MSTEQNTNEKTLEEILSVHAAEREERIRTVIEHKKELIRKAQAVIDAEDAKEGKNRLGNLFAEWKNLTNYRTEEENALWDEFQKIRQAFDGVLEKQRIQNKQAKETIIEEANKVLTLTNFKEANEKLNALLEQWKTVGSAGRDEDDALWKNFQKVRETLRENRQKYFEEQAANIDGNKIKKQELIDQTKTIVIEENVNWKQMSDKLNQMMDAWKAIGFAGSEDNDRLWDEFNAARKEIFDQRSAAFEEINAKREQIAQVKEALILEAKAIADTKDYSKENTEAMKQLDIRWKAAGNAGRERDDDLWNRFVEAKEVFWQGKQEIADAKRKEWEEKKKSIIASKKKQMKDLYEQIDVLKKSIYNSLDIPKITRVSGWIAEKQEIISGLKKEIKELEERK